jgi:hypothetical protein
MEGVRSKFHNIFGIYLCGNKEPENVAGILLYMYVIVGKARRKETFERPSSRSVDNIKMDLAEIGWNCMDWIDLAKNKNQWRAVVNKAIDL